MYVCIYVWSKCEYVSLYIYMLSMSVCMFMHGYLERLDMNEKFQITTWVLEIHGLYRKHKENNQHNGRLYLKMYEWVLQLAWYYIQVLINV